MASRRATSTSNDHQQSQDPQSLSLLSVMCPNHVVPFPQGEQVRVGMLLLGKSAPGRPLTDAQARCSRGVVAASRAALEKVRGMPLDSDTGLGKPVSRDELCDGIQRALDLIADLLTVIHNNVNVI